MRSSLRFLVCAALAAAASVAFANATNFPVINTADSGAGSLRQAITDANSNPGADSISFNIPGGGVHTISLGSALPIISGPVTIDAYTQPGAVANTNGPGLGLNGTLLIEIDGTNAGPNCLNINSNDVTLRGLVINRCSSYVVLITSGANAHIQGNYLGTNAAGNLNFASKDFWGVNITSSVNALIGGTTPDSRNLINASLRGIEVGDNSNTGLLIQGNLIGTNAAGTAALAPASGFGISLRVVTNSTVGGTTPSAGNVISGIGAGLLYGNSLGSSFAANVAIQGNFIGTDVTGTKVIGNSQYGIGLYNINAHVGGTAPGAGNVISGNVSDGIIISGGIGALIEGNFIGTDATGTLNLGNGSMGVNAGANDCVIGGTAPGAANVIAFNGSRNFSAGVGVSGQRVKVRGNRIFSTADTAGGGLGIDLLDSFVFGVTPNDAGDADSGPNTLQNFPIVTASSFSGAGATVSMTLNSTASTTFDVDVYANPPCATRPQEFLEGQTYLGSLQLNTDGSGNASVSNAFFPTPIPLPAGSRVTATATGPLGNTSEFSQRNIFSVLPISGPPAGGTSFTLKGMLFAAPATVTVGGVPATGITVTDPQTITATSPALPAGSVNPITVTSGGLTGTLANAFVSDFNDVPAASGVHTFVDKLVANAITAGCGAGNYCPSSNVTRAQMAVFLLRGNLGQCYVPPPATGTVFTDVPTNGFAAAYIEALAAAQVTGGCGGGNYCPNDPVTRAQMAVFLLRTQGGPTYLPPACTTATFTDVPCSNGFSRWIYELVARNITAGCGGGLYCPASSVTRGQMAVFLVTTFGLP